MARANTKPLGMGAIVLIMFVTGLALGAVLGLVGAVVRLPVGVTGAVVGVGIGIVGAVLMGRRRAALAESARSGATEPN